MDTEHARLEITNLISKFQPNETTPIKSIITKNPSLRADYAKLFASLRNDNRAQKKFNDAISARVFPLSRWAITDLINKLFKIYSERKTTLVQKWTVGDLDSRLSVSIWKLQSAGREIFDFLKSNVRGDYLDIGCGDGAMGLLFARILNVNPTFADIGNYINPDISAKYKFIQFTPDTALDDNQYGIVSCFHILHHIADIDGLKFRLKKLREKIRIK
jgi:2-polyprenyl-3-methyl-5-hydroxy-6-metoxy-1,4-benzoquinol methylase